MKKKLFAGICSIAIIAGSAIGLAACNRHIPTPAPNNVTMSAKDMMAISVASASAFLPSNGGKTALDKTDFEAICKNIDDKIAVVENFISSDATSCVEEVSDKVEYKHMFTITKKNLQGEVETFKIYYNQDLKPDDEEEKNFNALEQEKEFSLAGIMVAEDGTEYEMTGKKEMETETEPANPDNPDSVASVENESEFKAVIYFDKAADSKMVFKQEIEQENGEIEQEFVYSIYENGKLVDSFSIQIEVENNEQSVEYSDLSNGAIVESTKEIIGNETYMELYFMNGTEKINAELKIAANNDHIYKFVDVNGQEIVYTIPATTESAPIQA